MSLKNDRGRARSDGDYKRLGLDWVLNGAPNEVNTDDRATSVAADGHVGRNSPAAWLDVGNVDDELSTLVDQKVAGEIRDADFRVALSRLLDIKHARSVADIEDEALQRKNAYRRHASWTAGTSMENVAKATTSRRYRARATREALEENRRSNVENTRDGDDTKNDYSNSNSSHRQEERGGCSSDGIAEGNGGRETLPRDAASDGRPGQRIGREGLPPPGRRTPPGRRRTLSGLLTSSSSGPPAASPGGYLKEPHAGSSRSTSSSSSRSSSISSISSIGGYGLPEETPERILSGGAMSIGTGALFIDCSSSGFGIVPKTAAPPRNWRPPPAGTSGTGHRYQLAASGAVAGDSRWNARSGAPPASGTGIVGAKQQRKKQHEQQQQQRAQQGFTSTSAAATATADTPDLHESAGGTSSAESGFDDIPQDNRRSETSGGNDAGLAFDWTPATTGLLGRPSGMYPFLHGDDQNDGLGSDGAGFHTREAFAPNAGANASVGEQTSLSSQPATGGVKGEDRGREKGALAAAAGALPVAETRSAGSPKRAIEGSAMIVDRPPPEATATAAPCTCTVS